MKENSFKTPVLLLIFNRPECTNKVFQILKIIKPVNLFIAADGPREHIITDSKLCKQSRSIVDLIDWDCEVNTLFRDKNLGCKSAVSSAIKWFFNQVESGIVLEDDCIPDLSFFPYCEELLEKFREDERIGMICGRNDFSDFSMENSYDFSTSGSIWGWASWKRVMNNYDENDITLLQDFNKYIYDATCDKFEKNRLYYQLKWSLDGSLNTWDYQLHVLLKLSSMLYVIPQNNLISNIGFDKNATHTKSIEKRSYSPVKALTLPLKHPRRIIPNRYLSRKIVRIDSNNFLIWLYIITTKKINNFSSRFLKSNK